MTWAIPDLIIRGGLFQRAVLTAESEASRGFACDLHGFLVIITMPHMLPKVGLSSENMCSIIYVILVWMFSALYSVLTDT